VPVEEPSTASIGDMTALFDHLVGELLEMCGHIESERLCRLEVDD
jgi:hypothetical protein